jgi:hypothetical protein
VENWQGVSKTVVVTEHEIKLRFPNATPAFIRLNATNAGQADIHPDNSGKAAVLERNPGDGAMGEVQVQKRVGSKVLVRVTSIRKRLLDYDNLCEKYHVDLCRNSGVISGDGPATTLIEVCQQKAEPGAEEETRIEVFEV